MVDNLIWVSGSLDWLCVNLSIAVSPVFNSGRPLTTTIPQGTANLSSGACESADFVKACTHSVVNSDTCSVYQAELNI